MTAEQYLEHALTTQPDRGYHDERTTLQNVVNSDVTCSKHRSFRKFTLFRPESRGMSTPRIKARNQIRGIVMFTDSSVL